ncbi:hypothetical protein EYF80_017870 [Liparis tanakae]|uniref:Uncharacterized protein n=1 Tax=Liparis tanakae TaxID=230148 RepID=A0A4Z2I3P9_9TELE|nr:hypothetical protein EYF80_017870 [Liparis tanakae]
MPNKATARCLMNAEPGQWKVPAEALLWVTESRRPPEWAVRRPVTPPRADNKDTDTTPSA